jgi:ABC-type multidrug transport system fused ATPase/permease subunit
MNVDRELVNVIAFAAGVIISLACEWFPGLSEWFSKLTKGQKQGVISAACFLVALAMFGLACAGILAKILNNIVLECNRDGAISLVVAFLVAIAGAQLNHITINRAGEAIKTRIAKRAAQNKLSK